jgi:NADPH:quinone reductase-like Zn-dependent oxidoreductase
MIGAWRQRRLFAHPGQRASKRKQIGAIDITTCRDVDLVLDTLEGPSSARSLRTLKRGGMMAPVFLSFDGPMMPWNGVSRSRQHRCARTARNWRSWRNC